MTSPFAHAFMQAKIEKEKKSKKQAQKQQVQKQQVQKQQVTQSQQKIDKKESTNNKQTRNQRNKKQKQKKPFVSAPLNVLEIKQNVSLTENRLLAETQFSKENNLDVFKRDLWFERRTIENMRRSLKNKNKSHRFFFNKNEDNSYDVEYHYKDKNGNMKQEKRHFPSTSSFKVWVVRRVEHVQSIIDFIKAENGSIDGYKDVIKILKAAEKSLIEKE